MAQTQDAAASAPAVEQQGQKPDEQPDSQRGKQQQEKVADKEGNKKEILEKEKEERAERKRLEAELRRLAEKRKAAHNDLVETETKIYKLETSYLDETRLYGNVIRGWDEYLSNRGMQALAASAEGSRRRAATRVDGGERLFSLSSSTSPATKALEQHSGGRKRDSTGVVKGEAGSAQQEGGGKLKEDKPSSTTTPSGSGGSSSRAVSSESKRRRR